MYTGISFGCEGRRHAGGGEFSPPLLISVIHRFSTSDIGDSLLYIVAIIHLPYVSESLNFEICLPLSARTTL